jgi:pimeloyl-ACP methyl ester carboxylesterase
MSKKITFVHGLGQTESSWNKTVSMLNKNITSSCIPLFSAEYKENTYRELYRKFEKYCVRETEPIHLCGISLGAVLSLDYAVRHPEDVKSLVLIAPQYKMPKILLKLQNVIFLFIPNSQFGSLGLTKKGFIRLTNSMLDLSFEDKINHIACPTLIICGEKDSANKKAAVSLKKKISTSKLHFIKGAGHEVNITAPNRLAEILNEFYCDDKNIV